MPEPPHDDDRQSGEREAERFSAAPPVPGLAQQGGMRGRLRGAAIDLTPLRRHRDFRLLTAGQAVTFLGRW